QESADWRGVWAIGNFADSMIPLHGYRYAIDFRSTNPYWNVQDDHSDRGIYVGPGVLFDWPTFRVHIRLSHTSLKSQGAANYYGETDPRKLPLVIAVDRTALRVQKSQHLRIEDIVVRGSAKHTFDIADSDDIVLDGVTIYGGSPALWVKST